MKLIIYLPLLAGALLLGWQLLAEDPLIASDKTLTTAAPTATTAPLPQGLITESNKSAAQPMPSSLRGTEVDGQLQVDAHGNLVISDQLRHLFDYYLSAAGEERPEQTQERVRQQLTRQLQEPARGQALAIFQQYLDYLQAVAALEQDFPVLDDLDALWAREEAVQRLRASLFSAEVHQAFFTSEEVYNRFTLERLAINRNPDLTPSQRADDIEALRENLPSEMQQLLVPQLHQELRRQTQALNAGNADPQALRELRLNLVGTEATARLETLDQQRADWQQRVERFNRERTSILQQPGLAEQDKQAAIEALLQQGFAPNERLRLSGQGKG